MKVKKATLKKLIENYLNSENNNRRRFEVVSLKTRETEELGLTLIYIDTEEIMYQRIKNHEAKLSGTYTYIYCVDTKELMDDNWKTLVLA